MPGPRRGRIAASYTEGEGRPPTLKSVQQGCGELRNRDMLQDYVGACSYRRTPEHALVLHLPRGLRDVDRHAQRLAAAALAGAAHRGRTEEIEADGDAHVGVGRA